MRSSAANLGCPQCPYNASGEQSLAVHLSDVHGLAMATEAVPRARAIARDAARMSRPLVKLAAVGAPGSPARGDHLDEEEVDAMAVRNAELRKKPGKERCACGGVSRHKWPSPGAKRSGSLRCPRRDPGEDRRVRGEDHGTARGRGRAGGVM